MELNLCFDHAAEGRGQMLSLMCKFVTKSSKFLLSVASECEGARLVIVLESIFNPYPPNMPHAGLCVFAWQQFKCPC
jgi:hypothetical protein